MTVVFFEHGKKDSETSKNNLLMSFILNIENIKDLKKLMLLDVLINKFILRFWSFSNIKISVSSQIRRKNTKNQIKPSNFV